MQLICGMHRSGTSLVAGIAHAAGGDFGDEAGFHPADRWNPGGYFEQREVLDINIRLVNGPWGRAAYFRLPSDRTIERRAQRTHGRIAELASKYESSVVKENRFCLTLGAWRSRGLNVERLLIVYRDPDAVARSLWRRNRIPRFLAFSLWLEHYRRLFRHAEGIPVAVNSYDCLVSDSAGRKAECTKLAWLLGMPEQTILDAAGAVIRSGTVARSVPPKLPPEVRKMHEALEEQSRQCP